ncbi:MAG: hypothetical protein LBR16_03880 [Treponema sp.]|jgi:hypothetical protein|nr:hypothetical protein [Treponema sp.]
MEKTLFISFDIIRKDKGDPEPSYTMASLLAFLKNDAELAGRMEFCHLSINCWPPGRTIDLETELAACDPARFDYIALSAYIWNDYLVNDSIALLRKRGFRGAIILGGCQITGIADRELPGKYPDAQVFITGCGEQALKNFFHYGHEAAPAFVSERAG